MKTNFFNRLINYVFLVFIFVFPMVFVVQTGGTVLERATVGLIGAVLWVVIDIRQESDMIKALSILISKTIQGILIADVEKGLNDDS